jgi:hypothetical protein
VNPLPPDSTLWTSCLASRSSFTTAPERLTEAEGLIQPWTVLLEILVSAACERARSIGCCRRWFV